MRFKKPPVAFFKKRLLGIANKKNAHNSNKKLPTLAVHLIYRYYYTGISVSKLCYTSNYVISTLTGDFGNTIITFDKVD